MSNQVNIFRAISDETNEVHYVVGYYDRGFEAYELPGGIQRENVAGDYNKHATVFTSFEGAALYKRYLSYEIAAQAANKKFGYSKICPSGWDESLGEGYSPWYSKRKANK